jgi:hypothetical protein
MSHSGRVRTLGKRVGLIALEGSNPSISAMIRKDGFTPSLRFIISREMEGFERRKRGTRWVAESGSRNFYKACLPQAGKNIRDRIPPSPHLIQIYS